MDFKEKTIRYNRNGEKGKLNQLLSDETYLLSTFSG